MEIRIAGRHIQVTDAMKDYAKKKLSHLERYFGHIIEAHVIMNVEKNVHKIEVVLHTNVGKIFGEEKTNDMYTSIDKVLEKMEVQLKRQKEKIKEHKLKRELGG